jgi:hypothetical protein
MITALLTEIGRDARLAEGADPEEFVVSEAQVDQAIEGQFKLKEVLTEEDAERFKAGIEASIGWARYRELVRANAAFEKTFLPDAGKRPGIEVIDAEGNSHLVHMPMVTWNALLNDARGTGLRDMLNDPSKEGTEIGGFLRPHFARSIRSALLTGLDVESCYSGKLNQGILMRIGDKELGVDEVLPLVTDRVTPEDRVLALREILLLEAMDSGLEKAGYLLSDEGAAEAFAAHEKQYVGSIFPLAFMARMQGFYNLSRYENFYRRRAGFEQMIDPELNDVTLKEFYEGPARLLYENAKVKVQLIFFGAVDPAKGLSWAVERMDEVQARLQSGEDFETLAAEYHDQDGTFSTFDFEPLTRNHLRMALNDQPLSTLLFGFSLADYLFYRAEAGEIVGPLVKYGPHIGGPGHNGAYLVRVQEYTGSQELKPFNEVREMVRSDYLDLRFVEWAQEMLEQATIELTLD